jgi:hypothetical protein
VAKRKVKAAPKRRKKRRGANGRQKGKIGEREWRDVLIAAGYEARRGQQFKGGEDQPDVVCEELARWHFEVKRREVLEPYEFMVQAGLECGGKIPVVAMRKNKRDWLVLVRAADWLADVGVVRRLQRERDQATTMVQDLADQLRAAQTKARVVGDELRTQLAMADERVAGLERQVHALEKRLLDFGREVRLTAPDDAVQVTP